MVVLAPGSPHTGPSAQPPIDGSRNFSPHMSAESPSNIIPNPSKVISEVSELHYLELRIYLKLVRAECVRCPWLLAQTKVATIFGINLLVLVLLLLPLLKTL